MLSVACLPTCRRQQVEGPRGFWWDLNPEDLSLKVMKGRLNGTKASTTCATATAGLDSANSLLCGVDGVLRPYCRRWDGGVDNIATIKWKERKAHCQGEGLYLFSR